MSLPPYGTLERGSPLPITLGLYPLEDLIFIIPVAVTIFICRLVFKRFLIKPIVNRFHITKKNKRKLTENIWILLHRLEVILFGIYFLYTLEWVKITIDFSSFSSAILSFRPNVEILGNMVSQIYDEEKYPIFRYFYLFQIAYYAQSFFSIFFERNKRLEFIQLAIQHFTTLVLLIYSLGVYGHRIGFIICFINDVVDALLRISKILYEIGRVKLANISFIIFAITYTLLRIVLFPLIIIYLFFNPWSSEWISTQGSAVYWIKKDPSVFPIALRFDCIGAFGICFGPYRLLSTLLIVILINQFLWYLLVIKVVFDRIIKGKLKKQKVE